MSDATDFTTLPDLACARLGGRVLAANDEFFAPKENLLAAADPVSDPDRYTDRGKWMDGWETRRRREPGHDWCIVQLGLPGVPRGVVVDTSHFCGNYPESCSLEGCEAPADAEPGELIGDQGGDGVEWHEVLPRTPLAGDAENRFALASPYRCTHLRLRIYPDGGVARLRVHGEVVPRAAELCGGGALGGDTVDLASLALGARVVDASDRFFGAAANLLLPDEPRGMFDGWETRRRRGPGNDWVILDLAAAGTPERIEIDTSHFKGNAPGSCSIESDADPDAPRGATDADGSRWTPLLPRTPLQPHHRHELDVASPGRAVRRVRFQIYPDGGVARLRIFGRIAPDAAEAAALAELNVRPPSGARRRLLDCCGSTRWAAAMAERRPFADRDALLAAADEVADALERDDWLEAFAAHPPIGGKRAERPRGATAAGWSRQEQSAAGGADETLRRRLEEANRRYRERFGHLYIVCAEGKSGEEVLADLEARLDHDPDRELAVAAGEELKIARLRLAKLLGRSTGGTHDPKGAHP